MPFGSDKHLTDVAETEHFTGKCNQILRPIFSPLGMRIKTHPRIRAKKAPRPVWQGVASVNRKLTT